MINWIRKNDKLVTFCSLFLYFLYSYNISLNEYIYSNRIILFLTLLIPIFAFYILYSKNIKKLIPLNSKTYIFSFLVLSLIIFRNGDLINGHVGMPFYYIITIILFMLLCNSDNWVKYAKYILIIFSLEHIILTWFFYFNPNFYFHNIMPLFPESFQSDLLYQFNNKQMAGFTYHYSTNAIYLAVSCLLFLTLLLDSSRKKNRIFYLIFLILSVGALLLTGKRGHLLFVIITSVVICFLYFKTNNKHVIKKFSILLIIVCILFFIMLNFIPELSNTFERFTSFNNNDITNGRVLLYDLAIEKFFDNPLFGNGWGSYKYIYKEMIINNNYSMMDSHNIYFQMLCEVGIVGTIIILSILLYMLFDTYYIMKNSKISQANKKHIKFSFAIQLFVLLYGITGNPIYDVQMFFPYMIAIAFYKSIKISNLSYVMKSKVKVADVGKKIGILTFNDTTNYGAELQKYALQKYILDNGNTAEVIDYSCPKIEEREHPQLIYKQKGLRNIIKCIFRSDTQYIRYTKFVNFTKKYVNTSTKKYNKTNIISTNDEYDLFLVGSDQVWNMELNNNDTTYLLDFVDDDRKKISYAASFGYENIPEEYIEENKELLNKFSKINVREEQGKKIVNNICTKAVDVTIDPTFLLTKHEWNRLIENKRLIENEYIFVYLPFYSKENFRMIRKLAKQEKCKIVYIHGSLKNEPGMINLRTASPTDFINLIKNAKYIVTGSFHAICFSIIFEKQFYYTTSTYKKYNSRLENILKKYDLDNRRLDTYVSNNIINYDNIKIKLKDDIERSKEILNITIDGGYYE